MAADRLTVLFVCSGNICRSPAGEGVLKRLVATRGLEERIAVDSAGTTSYHVGEAPDRRMSEAAARRGYRLDGRARCLEPVDFSRAALIVAVDGENLRAIAALQQRLTSSAAGGEADRAEVRLLSDFLPPGARRDVPDPYYGGDQGFEVVLDMMEEAAPRILAALLGE